MPCSKTKTKTTPPATCPSNCTDGCGCLVAASKSAESAAASAKAAAQSAELAQKLLQNCLTDSTIEEGGGLKPSADGHGITVDETWIDNHSLQPDEIKAGNGISVTPGADDVTVAAKIVAGGGLKNDAAGLAVDKAWIKAQDDRVAGVLKVYCSKAKGVDTNDGLTANTPVATIDKALEVAHKRFLRKADCHVALCLDKGPWGAVVFRDLPFTLNVFPFNGTMASEYSADLPQFTFFCSYGGSSECTVNGIVVDGRLQADDSGMLWVNGYAKVQQLDSTGYGYLFVVGDVHFSKSTTEVNLCNARHFGKLFLRNSKFTLDEDFTDKQYTFLALNNSAWVMVNGSTMTGFNANTHTFNGLKLSIAPNCLLDTNTNKGTSASNGDPAVFESFFGTGHTITAGAIINGCVYTTTSTVGISLRSALSTIADDGTVTEPSIATIAEAVRAQRNDKLAGTDYLVAPDYPLSAESLEAVKTYRKQLRDLPLQEGFPENVEWPELPEIVKE